MLQKLGGGTPKGRVMLLAFYNTKALGVRYLGRGAGAGWVSGAGGFL